MKRTTLYLPDDLKESLERLAAEQGRSEADLMRSALRKAVEMAPDPAPSLPLSSRGLGDATVARRVNELLDGFGER